MEGDGDADRVDSVSKRSIVRNVRQKTVLLSIIVILCCAKESGGKYA
jgi:hypothetical protein